MRAWVHDFVDISSDDGSVPDCDSGPHEDLADDGGVGCDKDLSLIADVEVVEIHDVAMATEGFAVFPGGF